MDKLIVLKSLADETRLNILKILLNNERCVCEISPQVKRTQSTVSIQLKVLEKAGIIKSRKEGKWVYYKIINKDVLNILTILKVK